ncbi:hypothetical protein H4R34_003574 [Dimargaris verticillata]|uniref:Nudix hydrolase domain-containing protein n=1 Tax=Dimargaris verticillata TaxID=2761393 RepID=A0A9W8B4A1_9FUNG|nr:hypothetical protein H4R34_003574 [Dimargaris verticillata]
MEYGETFSQSCQREVEEETGLVVQSVRFICPKNIIFNEAQKHFVALFFAAECLQDDPIPVTQEPDKSEGWHWATWAEMRARKYAPLFGILDELVDEYPSEPWLMAAPCTS